MVAMASTLAFLLIGTTMLARWTHALPYAVGSPTVVSQEVLAVFGGHGFGHVVFYLVQLATMMILYTGGNTSFNGFPYLTNFVANDRFLPRQLTKRGHRLAFSNGIVMLGSMALVLVLVFKAQVNSLIALYAIGVFTAFTMAGAGMARRHWSTREHNWRLGFVVNALSSVVTLAIALIFAVVKFAEGAWIVVVSGPLMVLGLQYMHRQYTKESAAFEASKRVSRGTQFRHHRLVLFIDSYDLATERALQSGARPTPPPSASDWRSSSAMTVASIEQPSNSWLTSFATPRSFAWSCCRAEGSPLASSGCCTTAPRTRSPRPSCTCRAPPPPSSRIAWAGSVWPRAACRRN